MRYEIEWSQGSLKDIRRLDKPLIERITRAIEVFAETGRGDVKRLINADGAYRLRVGEWRVRFRFVHREIQIMLIQAVLPRSEAYKR
ncbi:type II toxin-antitoxin system RelE family toxin [Ferroacidibacillus organovorans]|uniref:Addiction module toxin RelE n=1 Tax=Ferroacidibacillus organovorans TaxID=1765683 RepID=A0A1V4ERP1_9BACL|nr:type II toxin-antitoxin system RelE/ParE family toxin [Ferroacidibacillus organovorans]OPG15424.1 hypothetical protein B2M26_11930 [Ferroacidibacillus organovorans]